MTTPMLLLALLMTSGATLDATQRTAVLAEAQAAYARGLERRDVEPEAARRDFTDAAARFALLLEEGADNGLLRYDLANARLQAGELGEAILEYRRAERLAPGDAAIRANLAWARTLRGSDAPSGPRILADRAARRLRPGTWWTLLIGAWSLGWLIVAFGRRLPAGTRRGAVALLLGTAGIAGSALGWSIDADRRRPDGVLLDEAVLRNGDGTGYRPVSEEPLPEGTEFTRLEDRGAWWRVRGADGLEGWIPSDRAALVPWIAAEAS